VKLDQDLKARLQFLCRVVEKESQYLQETEARLFAEPMTPQSLKQISEDSLLAERLDAFVGRFSRLQDTLTDKLLPALLDAMAEPRASAIENLDRAEKLNWIESADEWLEIRKLRNQMIHEYIEDPVILANALQAGHRFVPRLTAASSKFLNQVRVRIATA
jgi:formate dehydrogenase maturation protein FdhE